MKHIFGPVPSRRLGRSLGIDPLPLKTCNFNCVYCQLGRTSPLQRKRRAFFNISDMVAEIASTLARRGADSIDWITFVGSGETTLFSRLGSLIRYVKSLSNLPVAVITNGSLLHLPRVRHELCAADAVLPSLDAGSEALYTKINRPHRDFRFDQHVKGLIDFRGEFKGSLWVEVMLLGGVNDSPSDLDDISKILECVGPDEIHVSTPTRPPAEPWVRPPGPESLERAALVFGSVARVLQPIDVDVECVNDEELAATVLAIVLRHPMQENELVRNLACWAPVRVLESLATLAAAGRIRKIERHGELFWCAARARFPDWEPAGEQPRKPHSDHPTPGLPGLNGISK
jgi:wyosine [tRNA(Phe)-imidazoG37] synthetase (radical SAM superfamily)